MAEEVVGRATLDAKGFVAGAQQAGNAASALLGKLQNFATRANATGNQVRNLFNGVDPAKAAQGIDTMKQRLVLVERQAELLRQKLAELQNQKGPSAEEADAIAKKYELAARKVEQLKNALVQEKAKPDQRGSDEYKALEVRLEKLTKLKENFDKKMATTPPSKFGTLEKNIQRVERAITGVKNKMAAMQGPDPEKVLKLETALNKAETNADNLKRAMDAASKEPDPQAVLTLQKQLLTATTQASKLREQIAQAESGGGAKEPGGGMFSGMNSMFGGMRKSIDANIGSVEGVFRKAEASIMAFRAQVMNVNDAVRLVAQGITDMGRSLMFFFTLPVAAFMGGLITNAIDFEDAMMRVAKTADLSKDGLAQVTEGIRNLALTTATSHGELAGIAEVLGQLGIQDPTAIVRMTKIMDVFANATAQAADQVTTQMGQIAAAFGRDLGTSEEWVWQLMGAINTLENTTAATAGQIQTALVEFAPLANTLKLSAVEAAALSATMVTMGLSADEAGTALSRMSEFLIKNADDVSAAMGSYKDAYKTPEGVLNALKENSLQVFADIADAARSSENPMQAAAQLLKILGERGGKAALLLMQNLGLLKDNIDNVSNSMTNGQRLIEEYGMSMSTTKSQMGLLRNQTNELGLTIGGALLPVINRLVAVAVPGIKMITGWFKNLTQAQQNQVLIWGLLAVAIGPVLMLVGQVVHGFSLIFMGGGQLIRVFAALVGAFGNVAAVLMSVGKIFLGWPGLVLAGVAGILVILSQLGVDIAGTFRNMANAAKTWGENLAANLANGLLGGAVRYITRAISYIANLIASFFESHSPPKDGPLSTIDTWGKGLMNTFLKGFYAADFDILEDISNTIEHMLTNGLEDEALVGTLRQLAKARVKLSALISDFNKTGVINEQLLDDATQGLGDMGGKVKELVRLTLKYKSLQERLAQLEEKRKDVQRTYDSEIASIGQSNMSIVDKINAIRQVRRERDNSLDGIDKEEEKLKAQAELVKQQLDYQKGLIDTLNKQEDIFTRIAELLKQIAEEAKNEEKGSGGAGAGAGDLGGGGFDMGGGIDLGGIDETIAGAKEQIDGLFKMFDGFSDGKAALQGFIDAWKGLPMRLEEDLPASVWDLYQKLYDLGEICRTVVDKFSYLKDEAVKLWGEIQKFFTKDKNGDIAGLKGTSEEVGKALENLRTKAQPAIDTFNNVIVPIAAFLGTVVGIPAALLLAANGIGTLTTALTTLSGIVSLVVGTLGWPFIALIGIIAAFAAAWAGNWFGIRDAAASVANWITSTLAPVWESLKQQWASMQPSFQQLGQAFSNLWTSIQPLLPVIGQVAAFLGGVLAAAIGYVLSSIIGLVAGIAQLVTGFINGFTQVLSGVTNIFSGIISYITGFFQALIGLWTGNTQLMQQGWQTMADGLGRIIQGALQVIQGVVNFLITGVLGGLLSFITTTLSSMEGLFSGFTGNTSTFFSSLNTMVQEGLAKATQFFTETVSDWVEAGTNLVQGIIDGSAKKWSEFVTAAQEQAKAVIDAVKKAFGIASPSTIFSDIGMNLIQGLIDGVSDMISTLSGVIDTVVNTVLGGIQKLFGGGGGDQQSSGGFNIDTLLPNEQDVQARTAAIQSTVTAFLSSVSSQFATAGNGIVTAWQNVWNTIQQTAGNGNAIVAPFVSDVTSGFSKLSSTISSTWKSTWAEVTTVADSSISAVTSAVDKLASTISGALKKAVDTVSDLMKAFDKLASAAGNAEKQLAKFKTATNGMNTSKVTSMAGAWGKVSSNISSALSNLKSMLKTLSSLRNTTITVTISAKGSGAGVSMDMSGTQDSSNWSGKGNGSITPKASGGRVQALNMYRVGELGEELFVPDQNGSIVPHHMFDRLLDVTEAGGGSGGDNNFNITINNPVIRDGTDVRKLAEQVARELAKKVNGQMKFGGNISM